MSVTIELPSDIEAGLTARAKAQGLPLPEYLRRVLEEHASPGRQAALSPDERAAKWRQLVADLPRAPPLSDAAVSRESIYADRG